MKNLKHLFTALLLLCSTMAFAERVTIDGINYDVITKAKQAKVISGGNYLGDIIIPETVEYNGVTCSVSEIAPLAFNESFDIRSITIPKSITKIGYGAFHMCNIGTVNVADLSAWCKITFEFDEMMYSATSYPKAETYCLNGEKVTELIIPNDVAELGFYCFFGWRDVESVTIPNSVTSIGERAFAGCSSLTSIEIPNSVTSIGNQVFEKCFNLTNVIIGNSVTSIGDYAFEGCSSLTSVTIGNSVTSIGGSAFYECSGLTSITIPNSVTSIGDYAFIRCTRLTSVTIGNSVTNIGNYAFSTCYNIESIIVEAGNAIYDSRENCNAIIETASNTLVKGCSKTIIPNTVTSIGSSAFAYCSGLTNITIPPSVTSIGESAFWGCSDLTSITIPNSVTSIGDRAFAYCENLTDVYCYAIEPPICDVNWEGINAFYNSYPEYMTLHVPAEAINDYKATAPWSSFGTIVALDGEYIEPEVPEIKVCATPVLSYNNGKFVIDCETEGAEFVTDVTCGDIRRFYDSEINFSATYNIAVYATATGYEKSETVNATLCWIENGNGDSDNETNVINVPATAVFITSRNGELSINCALDGESVEIYTTGGTLVGTTTIENGNATIQTGLSKGSVAVVKIGNKSVKVILN